jgi:hypothetical protein
MIRTQTDLFDLLAPASDRQSPLDNRHVEPPISPVMTVKSSDVHWVHVTTKAAKTACGIAMPAVYLKLGCGYSDTGAKLSCTHNRDDGTVTCQGCLEAMQ